MLNLNKEILKNKRTFRNAEPEHCYNIAKHHDLYSSKTRIKQNKNKQKQTKTKNQTTTKNTD